MACSVEWSGEGSGSGGVVGEGRGSGVQCGVEW